LKIWKWSQGHATWKSMYKQHSLWVETNYILPKLTRLQTQLNVLFQLGHVYSITSLCSFVVNLATITFDNSEITFHNRAIIYEVIYNSVIYLERPLKRFQNSKFWEQKNLNTQSTMCRHNSDSRGDKTLLASALDFEAWLEIQRQAS
jgi:hypothetical protein